MSCSEHGTTLAFPLGGRCHEVTEEGRSHFAAPCAAFATHPAPLCHPDRGSERNERPSRGILCRTQKQGRTRQKEFVIGALARKTHSTARLTLLLAAPLRVTKWGHLKRVSPLPLPLLFLSFPFSCSVLPFLLRGVCIFLISDRCCPSAAARAPSLFCRSFFSFSLFPSPFFRFSPSSFFLPFPFLVSFPSFPFSPLAALFMCV